MPHSADKTIIVLWIFLLGYGALGAAFYAWLVRSAEPIPVLAVKSAAHTKLQIVHGSLPKEHRRAA